MKKEQEEEENIEFRCKRHPFHHGIRSLAKDLLQSQRRESFSVDSSDEIRCGLGGGGTGTRTARRERGQGGGTTKEEAKNQVIFNSFVSRVSSLENPLQLPSSPAFWLLASLFSDRLPGLAWPAVPGLPFPD